MKKSNQIKEEDIAKEFNCDVNLETTLSQENKMALSLKLIETNGKESNERYEKLNSSKKLNKRYRRLNLSEYTKYTSTCTNSTNSITCLNSESKEIPVLIETTNQNENRICLTLEEFEINPGIQIKENNSLNDFLQKLIFRKDVEGCHSLLKKNLHSYTTEEFESFINQIDLRGNSPVMLCTLLRCLDRCQEYLQILSTLFSFGANPKLRNNEGTTPLELATAEEDQELVFLIYENLLTRRNLKIKRNMQKASLFLSMIPNFYLEMNWEVYVPLLSFLCPHDSCKIWKYDSNVVMDYTFAQYRNLKSQRKPSSFLFRGEENSQILKIDHQSKTYFNPFEPLEEDEKILIVSDIMNAHRINGEFKLKKCEVSESKSYWSGKPVYETVNNLKTKKYEVNMEAYVNLHDQEKSEYTNLNEENYFNPLISITRKKTMVMDNSIQKTRIADKLKVKNERLRKEILKFGNKKDKKLKAYVWIADNYPIKSSDLVTLFDSLSSANEYTQKVKEFLNQPEVKKIIEKNGFPIKILIPVNFMVDVTVQFANFKCLNNENITQVSEKFRIPQLYNQISRKSAQNLVTDDKRRLGYANIQG